MDEFDCAEFDVCWSIGWEEEFVQFKPQQANNFGWETRNESFLILLRSFASASNFANSHQLTLIIFHSKQFPPLRVLYFKWKKPAKLSLRSNLLYVFTIRNLSHLSIFISSTSSISFRSRLETLTICSSLTRLVIEFYLLHNIFQQRNELIFPIMSEKSIATDNCSTFVRHWRFSLLCCAVLRQHQEIRKMFI